MKRVDPYVFRIAGLLFLINCSDCLAIQQAANIITSSNRSVPLRHWQMSRDQAPRSAFQIPSESLWLPLYPSVENGRYDEGNWLIRTDILIDDSLNKETTWGIFFSNLITAYELYWDGFKVAQNGIIGNDGATEQAGVFNYHVPLPHHLATRGKHTIILRVSNHHNYSSWKWFYGDIVVGPYDVELRNKFRSSYQAYLITGILSIPFLFNMFLYIARKRRTEHLLFSLICFLVILDHLTNQVPLLLNTPTTYIHLEVYAYQTFSVLLAVLFPAFFTYTFSFPKSIIGFVAAAILVLFMFFTNIWSVFNVMALTVLVVSSIITGWAVWSRREGSTIIVIGIMLGWVAYFFDLAYAGLAAVMVICTSFSIALQFARKEKAERAAQLRSAQLENVLLKKNINPHFILNTLTSIIVWLRKDTASAIRLIEALAEEFRIITQVSSLKQIPLQQEIDLCKAHLRIMNYRKGADYRLETVDLVEEENVPPMILHTLIENGLTHGYENKLKGTFTLQRRKNPNSVQYVVSHDGDFAPGGPKNSSGFGMRYIKSRLEESYPNRWAFASHRQANGWETIIEIRDK